MTESDYPRMMFHRTHAAVVVLSEQEEAWLGAEWTRDWNPDLYQPPPPDLRMPTIGADGTRFPPLPEPEPALPPPSLAAEEPEPARRKPPARKKGE